MGSISINLQDGAGCAGQDHQDVAPLRLLPPSQRGTRSSWLNFALRDDEPVYWVSIGQQCLVLGGTESL